MSKKEESAYSKKERGITMKELFFGMNPYTFTGSAVIIGLYLNNELTPEEQASIGNWLQLIGLTVQTYASQVANLEAERQKAKKNTDCNDTTDLDTLSQVIDKIQEELNHLKECQKDSL